MDDMNGESSKNVDVRSESKSHEVQHDDEAARQQRRGGEQQEDNDQDDGRMNHAVSLLQEKYR